MASAKRGCTRTGGSDKQWVWNAGFERRPSADQTRVFRGMGTLTRRGNKSATLHVGEDLMVTRLETANDDLPLFVMECHFPRGDNTKGHQELWKRIRGLAREYGELGHVVLMGDFNSHTKSNGDETEVDVAGKRMMKNTDKLRLHMVNQMEVCTGQHTRFGHGSQKATTIGYAFVSRSLLNRVKGMELGETLGSDHRFVTLTLSGMRAEPVPESTMREVWRTENLPESDEDINFFVSAFEQTYADWTRKTESQMRAMEAVGVEASRISDIVEWSFQAALDSQSNQLLGTKLVGPKSTPMLDSAMRMLDGQRKACESILKKVMANGASTAEERATAVELYRDAKASLFTATRRRKESTEQEAFRQIEKHQANSKLLWSRAKRFTGRLKTGISPPPLALNDEGKVESDPVQVLKIWRRFSSEMASMTQEEMGKYNDDYKEEEEARLERLRIRSKSIVQPALDGPITVLEVFRAIRRMKMGKAPGVDGVLSSIIRHATDAVGTNKLKPVNSLVDALVLMFNYVFDNEEWPERWGEGIIFPLYKHDGRLEPGNYRPITLLSVVGKLFGLIVEKRLSDWSEMTGAISDEQGGFRRERGTADQIFILRELLSSRKERGLPTIATYIDAR